MGIEVTEVGGIAVDSTDLRCPLCEYDVRGLPEPRCPECGHQFEWEELTDPARKKHPYLFEHHLHKPLWSYLRTQFGALNPFRFWTVLRPVHRLGPGQIVLYSLVGFVLTLGLLGSIVLPPAIHAAMPPPVVLWPIPGPKTMVSTPQGPMTLGQLLIKLGILGPTGSYGGGTRMVMTNGSVMTLKDYQRLAATTQRLGGPVPGRPLQAAIPMMATPWGYVPPEQLGSIAAPSSQPSFQSPASALLLSVTTTPAQAAAGKTNTAFGLLPAAQANTLRAALAPYLPPPVPPKPLSTILRDIWRQIGAGQYGFFALGPIRIRLLPPANPRMAIGLAVFTPLSALLVLGIMRQTFSRVKLRPGHAVRVALYSTDLLPLFVTLVPLALAVGLGRAGPGNVGLWQVALVLALIYLLFAMIRFHIGAKRYLGLPAAGLVTATVVVITFLSTLTLVLAA